MAMFSNGSKEKVGLVLLRAHRIFENLLKMKVDRFATMKHLDFIL